MNHMSRPFYAQNAERESILTSQQETKRLRIAEWFDSPTTNQKDREMVMAEREYQLSVQSLLCRSSDYADTSRQGPALPKDSTKNIGIIFVQGPCSSGS